MINEKQLQQKIVMKFSQTYPEKEGQLFSVRNTTFSGKDGATQKAMGMKAGVSDLIYFDNGDLVGIEIKFPGKAHERSHIIKQITWGETIEANGGEYFIATSISGFMSIIKGEALDSDVYTLEMIKEKMENSKSQIIF